MAGFARIALAALAVIVLAAGAACGDDDEVTPTQTGTLTASPTAPESPTPTQGQSLTPSASPAEEPFSGARDPVEKEAPAVPPAAIQTDTRYAAHADFDRVTFDFAENAPGYLVEYVEPPILADPSAMEVEIDGEAFIQIRFLGAQAHDEAGNTTVDDLEIMPGLDSILEIERTGDFEGYLTWVLGLPEELDFRVIDLSDPTRVVVDVGHP